MLICILSCSTNLFAQSKQAIQQYEAGLMALEKNEPKKAIQYFTIAAAKDSQYLDPIIALFQVHFENPLVLSHTPLLNNYLFLPKALKY